MANRTVFGEVAGVNDLMWRVENQVHTQVASGLYLYVVQVNDSKTPKNYHGKIAVLH